MASPRRCTVLPPLAACSAVAVRGRRSATGQPMIARNFDYLPLVQPMYTLRESHPEGRLRSLEFTMAPLAGAVDGVNERGLAITYDYAFAIDDAQGSGPPISASISAALARAATVGEAAEIIMGRPRWGGGLLMLADAEGDIASLELSSTRSALRRPAAGEDVICHTNAFSTERMQAVQVAADAIFTAGPRAAPRPPSARFVDRTRRPFHKAIGRRSPARRRGADGHDVRSWRRRIRARVAGCASIPTTGTRPPACNSSRTGGRCGLPIRQPAEPNSRSSKSECCSAQVETASRCL